MSRKSLLFALVSITVASACSDPKCPPPYMQYGKWCRLCPPGEDKEQGKCVPIRDAATEAVTGETEAGENAPAETEEDLGDAELGSNGGDGVGPESMDPIFGDAGQAADAASAEAGDVCSANSCQHGGKCSGTGPAVKCDCVDTGYAGATCEVDVDECASPNSCTKAAYPCAQTEAPGYTCQGQFADWPMPDTVIGAKAKTSYDTSSVAQIVIDNVTGLAWLRYPPSETRTWDDAKAYCENLEFGGFGDWRLPSRIELESIVDDETRTGPRLNQEAFQGIGGGAFFSASPVVGFAGASSWLVDFGSALTWPVRVSGILGNVQCTRTARPPVSAPAGRYAFGSTAGRAIVTDTRTSLIWERDFYPIPVDRPAARARCASLGGRWRVPTKKELLTLVDPTIDIATPPVLDLDAFPGTPADATFWSVSVSWPNGEAWVLAENGTPSWSTDMLLHYVRCVQ